VDDYSLPVLQQLVGESLRTVEALVFMPPRETIPSLDNLDQLRITIGTESIRFRCSSNGEEIAIDRDELTPCNLGEYGDMRQFDLTHHPLFAALTTAWLRQVSQIESHGCRYIIGYVFEFSEGSLVICNWGDELKVWPSIPQTLFADEKIQITSA